MLEPERKSVKAISKGQGHVTIGLATSLSRGKKQEKEKKRERLVILGMLINIHEQSSLASIFKNYGVIVNCFIEA